MIVRIVHVVNTSSITTTTAAVICAYSTVNKVVYSMALSKRPV